MKDLVKRVDKKLFHGLIGWFYVMAHTYARKYIWPLRTITFDLKSGFLYNGKGIDFYIHGHNINHPPFRMTERCIELALADLFLRAYADVVEIGAVTPYYWPNRIQTVVDPYDKSSLVTDRVDWLDFDRACDAILSISTFEHIGLDDYGLERNDLKGELAFRKLISSRCDFLVTWPGGYNPKFDALVLDSLNESSDFHLYVWQRGTRGNDFKQIQPDDLVLPLQYGPDWANTVLVLHRGAPFA